MLVWVFGSMAIILYLGKIGSGKTLMCVRDMILNRNNCNSIFSNIRVDGYSHIRMLTSDMILKDEVVDSKVLKSGEVRVKSKKVLNIDFWKEQKPPISVVLDEGFTMMNSRRSMSSVNIVLNMFTSMLRRVLSTQEGSTGDFVVCAQRLMQLDVNLRESANVINYCVCFWRRVCGCGFGVQENSEMPRQLNGCPRCGATLIKRGHIIQVLQFEGVELFQQWYYHRLPTYFHTEYVRNVSKYFNVYNTLQWENMFESEY